MDRSVDRSRDRAGPLPGVAGGRADRPGHPRILHAPPRRAGAEPHDPSLLRHRAVSGAFAEARTAPIPMANREHFRSAVPLPPGLKLLHLEQAMNAAQRIIATINSNLLSNGGKALYDYIQGNNFSGLVSNIFCDSLHDHSAYKHNSHQAYPDLVNAHVIEEGKPAGLEVKSTIQAGKGGESHNGHSGWHMVACYRIDRGNLRPEAF